MDWEIIKERVLRELRRETLFKEVPEMETKSRYQVIAELQQKKMGLIKEKENFEEGVRTREKEIKDMNRKVEDSEEELEQYKESLKQKKEINEELIKSIDESLKRFESMVSQSQKK